MVIVVLPMIFTHGLSYNGWWLPMTMTLFWISCGISWPLYDNYIFPWHCCLWNLPNRVPEYHGIYLRCPQFHDLLETSRNWAVNLQLPPCHVWWASSLPCLIARVSRAGHVKVFLMGKSGKIEEIVGILDFQKKTERPVFWRKLWWNYGIWGTSEPEWNVFFFSSQCFLNSEMAHKNCTFDKWLEPRANHNSSWKPNFTTCPPHSLLTNRPQAHQLLTWSPNSNGSTHCHHQHKYQPSAPKKWPI